MAEHGAEEGGGKGGSDAGPEARPARGGVRLLRVDAFAAAPFCGNPAGVALLEPAVEGGEHEDLDWWRAALPDAVLAKIANEVNLSETAFVVALPGREDRPPYRDASELALRWMTPETEVGLCGHATLAAAAALFSLGNTSDTLRFTTKSGQLECRRDAASPGSVLMEFPCNRPYIVEDSAQAAVAATIASHVLGKGRTALQTFHCQSTGKLILRLEDALGPDALQALEPDYVAMMGVVQTHLPSKKRILGVSVTVRAPDGAREDFFSRYFNPWVGINEDPVNGSSHTILTPLWAQVLDKEGQLVAGMLSSRGGTLRVSMVPPKADGPERVAIGGDAQVVMEGRMMFA